MREKHIGRLIEARRRARKLSADQLAVACNVSRSRIYQWEKDTRIMPKNLPALARALGLPISALLAENGPRPVKGKQKKPRMSNTGHIAKRRTSVSDPGHSRAN